MMKLTRREFVALAGAAGVATLTKADAQQGVPTFAPDLDSLAQYHAPDWFATRSSASGLLGTGSCA